jgi:hypothetical protein
MTFSRRELDHAEIEEAAQMAITSAFQAYSHNNNASNYYDNPQLAVYMAQNPDLHIPTDEEMVQRQKAALEQAQADEAAADDHGDLDAHGPNVLDLVGNDVEDGGVNAVALVTLQRLARDFEHDAVVFDPRFGGGVGHGFSLYMGVILD